jgi:pyruvate,water dikinase
VAGQAKKGEACRQFDGSRRSGSKDTGSVGGKGANLGELTAGGLPVPPGFVITGEAYLDAVGRAGIRERLMAILAEARTASQDDLDRLASEARDLVHRCPIPDDLAAAVLSAYERLGDHVRVAVRSSGIGEDAEGTSFAGMNETFTNVAGDDEVLARLVDCWTSLWGARSIFYRGDKSLTAEPAIAVVVQEMIPSERSGVMFTVDPSTGETDRIVIEAAFGQGEVVVSGHGRARHLRGVDRNGPRLLHVRVGTQSLQDRARSPTARTSESSSTPSEGSRRVLSRRGGGRGRAPGSGRRGALRLTPGHGVGHGGAVTSFLVQSRPVTAVGGDAAAAVLEGQGALLVQGLAASAGRASGVVRVLQSPDQGRSPAGQARSWWRR